MKDFKELNSPEVSEDNEKFMTFDKFAEMPSEEKYKTFDAFAETPVEEEQVPAPAAPVEETSIIQTIANWKMMGDEMMTNVNIGETVYFSIQRNKQDVWTFKEINDPTK